MDFTVYVPDALGRRIKTAEPKLRYSELFQEAATAALDRQEAKAKLLESTTTWIVDVDDDPAYQARLHGQFVASGTDCQVFLTETEELIVYDERNQRLLRDFIIG